MHERAHESNAPVARPLFPLALTALGVVFGDIGTSPLYALRECFAGPHAIAPTPDNIRGVLSLVFWALVVVISVKYLGYVMRADNRGEGGILALVALTGLREARDVAPRGLIVTVGLFGAALLYGDGAITPAISVLAAVEGLNVATPVFEPYVLPVACLVLVGLFLVQKHGTARVGALFGPVMLLWFATLASLGLAAVLREPGILTSLWPGHGLAFLAENGGRGFLVLGAVFLVVTGGEALYADMGHFGYRPIRLVWFAVALPALMLNYLGQGALLLAAPGQAEHAFFALAPDRLLYPLVILATAATVIASQAVISGVFSLTRQAVQLGYAPRMVMEHTSEREIGQIYVPAVNWSLMIATIALVLAFGRSSRLAAAYGIAVTGTMVITTLLAYFVARRRWGWPVWAAVLVTGGFLVVDLAFLGANLVKVADGGWVPLVIGAGIYLLMATWKRGRALLRRRLQATAMPLEQFLKEVERQRPHRVERPAVYMTGSTDGIPPALVHNLRHNRVLHHPVLLLTVVTDEVPRVAGQERLAIEELADGFLRVIARYGFMEQARVAEIIGRLASHGLVLEMRDITFFLGRETLIATARPGMARWRERLFAFMSRNAARAAAFYQIPSPLVFEVGTQLEL